MATEIAPIVKELRSRLDLTQGQLAERLKVSLPTISRWETGKSEPDAQALHVLEEFLRRARSAPTSPLVSFRRQARPRRLLGDGARRVRQLLH